MPPVVDIGIPIYERAHFVAQAVDSVLAQTLQDWRLTISEDGPGNAAVRAAVEPYLGDSRIAHVTTGRRLGLPGHKTRLIQTGTAPYVAILDDDDLWDPEFLARRVSFLDAHPDCGFAFSEHLDIDQAGTALGRSEFSLPEGWNSAEAFTRACMERNIVGSQTMLTRRSAYEACGPAFDANFQRICDWEICLRLGMRFPVGYLRVHDARYRLHDHRMSLVHDGGLDFYRLVGHVDAMLATHLPQLRRSEAETRRLEARHLVGAALDAVEGGDRRGALRLLVAAGRRAPRRLVGPRAAGLVLGLVAGRRGRAWLSRLRTWSETRG